MQTAQNFRPSRRHLLATALLAPWCAEPVWPQSDHPTSVIATPTGAQRALSFPRDLGSHPDSAIEWWYITGALQARGQLFGFQLTFFRTRVPTTQNMSSAFAAKQLVFAHAAVTDVAGKRLLHDQRIARSSGDARVDLASVSELDTRVKLKDWSLERRNGHYLARVSAQNFAFALTLTETQALLLQGDQGWSRKGPQANLASYYYSLPQLAVAGDLTLEGQTVPVTGRAWLDHEWSHALLPADAVGWDWIGMNLHDGSALTAFRLRDKQGGSVWAGGSWRQRDAQKPVVFAAHEVVFKPERYWTSTASGASYPVSWSVELPLGAASSNLQAMGRQRYTVRAMLDNQELDSRRSTGAIYWEGLSQLLDAQGQVIGRGYLEMTGYASPLQLS